MQKSLIYIDINTRSQVDASGKQIKAASAFPSFDRGQWQVLCINFVTVNTDDLGINVVTPYDLSGKSYMFVADNNFDDEDSLMLKSYQSTVPFDETDPTSNRINIEGDWVDGTTADMTLGQMSVRVNSNTEKFKEVLGSKASLTSGLYINIKQYAAGLANPSNIAWIPFTAKNTVRDDGAAEETPPTGEQVVALLDSYFKSAMEYEYSLDGVEWHTEQTRDDNYYRQRLKGVGGAWGSSILIANGEDAPEVIIQYSENGSDNWGVANSGSYIRFSTDGGITWSASFKYIGSDAPLVQIQYSADGGTWGDTPENAVYIRFSADGGNTWSTHKKYVGSDAPQVLIEYSATGTANTWHGVYEQNDYFMRFSVDDGVTWGNSMQFKAYRVSYQYGTSATGEFHATFNAAEDKYVRWSVDGGSSWSAAAKFMGDKGDNFTINATGTLEGRSAYDSYPAGFSYLVTSGEQNGYIYFRISDTAGTWGDAIKFTPEGVAVEYSADGVVWSSTPDENTVYMRFSVDGGVSWKEAVQIKGTSTYIYTAYASDASGNNFSTTRSSDLDYWNWIYSNTPIAESDLTAERFSAQGSGWTQFQGDDGISYDWLSGTSAPSAGDGKDGDWYIDTAKGDMYKKISGAWVWQMNTVGKSGTGVTLKGEWDISTAYSKDDGVSYSGSFYIAKRSNTGKIPADNPDDWVLYVEKGEQGVPGAVLDGLYQDVTEISEDGFMVFDKKAVPCMVEIADRTFDIGEITVTDTAFKVPVAPLLAAADIAAFSGTWRVWFNGGAKGEKGDKGDLTDFRNAITFTAENIDLNADTDTVSSYALRIRDKNAQSLGAFIVHQGDNQAGVNVIRMMLQVSNVDIPVAGVGIEIKRNSDGTYSSNTFATPEPEGSANDSQIATTAWVQNAIKKALANQ